MNSDKSAASVRVVTMRMRSIVIILLLCSVFFAIFPPQAATAAKAICLFPPCTTVTSTIITTTTTTLIGTGPTTIYQTSTQVTSVPTTMETTSTSTEEVPVPAYVMMTQVGAVGTTCVAYPQPPYMPPNGCSTIYQTITQVGEYYYYTQSTTTTTYQYSTSEASTSFSITTTTSTYTTTQGIAITNTNYLYYSQCRISWLCVPAITGTLLIGAASAAAGAILGGIGAIAQSWADFLESLGASEESSNPLVNWALGAAYRMEDADDALYAYLLRLLQGG